MNTNNPLESIGAQAKQAALTLQNVSNEDKNNFLLHLADSIELHSNEILQANGLDLDLIRTLDKNNAFIDRLTLTDDRIKLMAQGIRQVASLPDPVGQIMDEWSRPNGLKIKQVRVPLGVIGFIYESRATVTCDATALCIKSGNAVILRGGKEAKETNRYLAQLIQASLIASGLPEYAVQLLSSGNREEVTWLAQLDQFVNVIIPRGGKGLIKAIMECTKIPVLKHLDGVCHAYVDAECDLQLAVNIIDDGKTQRPGVCNALETILVHQDIAEQFLPLLAQRLNKRNVECRVDAQCKEIIPDWHIEAQEEDWSTEYEDLIVSIKIVKNIQAAIDHINHYGSHHSEVIISNNEMHATQFLQQIDSACVYHNASTRFSDGNEFGFGAEIGIGTDKLHARGPMALRELTSYKYIISGDGQTKDPSRLSI